uniref:Carboxypeptidase n=1 Tax=Ditylenchus dipsaci TaxID=166011 RepID=A0A915E6E4_9BILA
MATPLQSDNKTVQICGELAYNLGFLNVWKTLNDAYNTYTDCYATPADSALLAHRHQSVTTRQLKKLSDTSKQVVLPDAYNFVDQAKLINQDSTDAFLGGACYWKNMALNYLRNASVIKALHVDIEGLPAWSGCNDVMNNNYVQQYFDTTPVFHSIFSRVSPSQPLKFLIYNGDVDMKFTPPSWFSQQYKFDNGKATLNVITVKGAGHMVAMDRPGPILQALYNFPSSALKSVSEIQNPVTKEEQDKIWDLPGLTYTPTFAQYSGYVNGAVDGNYMFYWMVEPQFDLDNAPVLLWLTGGPGCSGLGALLTEHGPFQVNPDGNTLFENQYSWNKAAFVIYLDSPRGVGFSYQDTQVNSEMIWNDEKTAADVAAAVKQLYQVYQSKLGGREFYVTGESYGGVYVPAITKLLIEQLEAGEKGPLNGLNLNLRGMSIGNGYFSNKYSMATSMDFLYYHGVIGKNDYDSARKCCVEAGQSSCQFNFSIDGCPERLSGLFGLFYNYHIDVYNIYQNATKKKNYRLEWSINKTHLICYLKDLFNYASNDASFGFPAILLTKLLIICNKNIRQYNNEDRDMTSIFKDIISSKYVDQLADSFKILIYNGDADLACTFLEAEFFIDNLVDEQMGLTIAEKQPWFYSEAKTPDVTVAAGFRKSFEFSNTKENAVILDLLTVKGADICANGQTCSGPAYAL